MNCLSHDGISGEALPICNVIGSRFVAANLKGFCEKLANPLSKGQKYVDSSCVYLIEYSNVKQYQQSGSGLVVEDAVFHKARTVVVDQENVGRRLDNFLIALLKNTAKSYVYRIIRSGEVRVNGGRKKAHTKLGLNDRVRIPPFKQSTVETPVISASWRNSIREAVLYEDETLAVLNKPPGLSVHAGSGKSFGLIDIVRQELDEKFELAHRLDKDTSGCILLGKSPSATRHLHRQFREGEVNKQYKTLLRGRLPQSKTTVSARLTTQRRDLGEAKTRVSRSGKSAQSSIVRLKVFDAGDRTCSYAEVSIATGRTHQIRVHAAHIGHPVAGDPRYGDVGFNQAMEGLGLGRTYLHAARMRFKHPIHGRDVSVSVEEPEQLRQVLGNLGSDGD